MRLDHRASFEHAGRQRNELLLAGSSLCGFGLLLIAAAAHAGSYQLPVGPLASMVGTVGSSLLIPAAGFLTAGILAAIRHRLFRTRVQQSNTAPGAMRDADKRLAWRRFLPRLRRVPRPNSAQAAAWITGAPQALLIIALCLIALTGIVQAWRASEAPPPPTLTLQVLGGLLLVAAFPLLVLERIYANRSSAVLPEAGQLNRLLRLPLTVSLLLGIGAISRALDFPWGVQFERLAALLVVVVAIELILRSAATLFIPFAPIEDQRSLADSSLAGFLRLALPNFRAVNEAVQSQFGIDLSRSFALAFMRRAAVPTAFGLGIFAWAVTGVTAVGVNERDIYERFGVPAEVFGPGLHVHLPWPFGIMRNVEFGVVHEIPIVVSPTDSAAAPAGPAESTDQPGELVSAEAPAPASADRLWDATHPSEASYLIASEERGQQSFQIANIDLRVVYRIGLSDAAAKDAAYSVASPQAFIQAAAGELLVRYFARYTLIDVLGQSREAFANDFRTGLQTELDRMSTGIEAIAVVVEAIHPPPGAASAYHNVQAAEILAMSRISFERADAVRKEKAAEQAALVERDQANAAAAELVDGAKSESVLFEADHQSYAQDGRVVLFERWLDRLSNSLGSSQFIVLDHRLTGATGPVLDLRDLWLPGPTTGTDPNTSNDSGDQ